MLYMPATRKDFLFLMPRGGEVAEIGVAAGEFSRHILDAVKPDRLHLIDPWCRQERADYEHDPNNWSPEEGEARYQGVLAAFRDEIGAGRVTAHRDFSTNVAPSFPDGTLDWVFIDGLHSYDGVKADLEAFAPKVKPDGFILGHDYAKHHTAREMGFGVVKAVDEFVGNFGYRFLALTGEAYPTYVLARNAESPATQALLARIFFAIPGILEIRDFPGRDWEHCHVPTSGGTKAFMSF